MATHAALSPLHLAFELGVYAVAVFVLYSLWRTRRAEIPLLLAAIIFAGALEITDIRTTHSYYYARFLLMIGREPDWFPVAIAVAWGLVLHTVMAAGERLPGSAWTRPFTGAVLGVAVDLLLDPVVASARVVSQIGQVCDAAGLPHGSAHGVGLWVWCVPAFESNLIWGIPFANFFAWGVVVLGFTAVAQGLRTAFDGEHAGTFGHVVLAIATGLIAFCLVDVILQLYTPVVMAGVPEWALLALVFGPGAWVLLHAGVTRAAGTVPVSSFIFPATAVLYCVAVYALAGVAAQGGLPFALYVAAVTAGCAAVYGWTLFGPRPLWELLGQSRKATRRGPAPSRAALLAQGPTHVPLADLARVTALRDPVLRNYMITQRYRDLSVAFARAVAGPNANWCTFATWASKTAGESIRNEEVPAFVRKLLQGEQRLHALVDGLRGAAPQARAIDVFDVARDTLSRVSSQVADGNRKVFAELAPLFSRFVDCFDQAGAIDDAEFERLLAGLRAGSSDSGGQEPLKQAFTAYREASREPDERRRAEWMLLGNCLIGLHEQTRLQPNIAAAIDAPVDVSASEGVLAGITAVLPPALRRDLEFLCGPSGQVALRIGRAVWQRVVTAAAMHLSLPGGARIPLAEDVEVSLGEQFPSALRSPTLPALRELIARFDADHAAPGGHGAGDWASLHDRMRFIIDLFRATQEQAALFEQPFDPALRLEIETRYAAAIAAAERVQDAARTEG
jgi:hypothetical protein